MGELEMVPQSRAGGMQEVASSRQAQEVQAMVVMARRFPRDNTQAITRILEDCSRIGLAEKATYAYPRGGTMVTGPSIRLAETIARRWGNVDCGIVELERRQTQGNLPGESVMLAFCWDLETNTRVTKTFTVAHTRDSKKGGKQNLTDERDIYEMTANYGARRLRACILGIIPIDIIEDAVAKCEATMKGGQGPIIDRVRSIVLKFKDIGVSQEMIEKRLGHKIEVTTEAELVKLKQIGLSIQDGMATREDYFELSLGMPQETPEEPSGKKQKAKTIRSIAPPEPEAVPEKKQEPEQPSGFSRAELGKLITQEVKRLKYKAEDINALIKKNFNKDSLTMTDGEMGRLIDLLGTLEPKK